MRLSKIKLAGFKSFVDPTVIHLPANLMGVVGPNGCGKSNVIDAVRWVMGESSAKYLRGESMEDVIFNGSSSRKPVGQASIELVFDNSDGSIGGEYSRYAEISTRRMVSRDGQSVYSLNGARCRRRDITDLFLGTGLGPRSYAIIEQGMIARIIEARPEELRGYLEEAAGISKYKERRRETESRMEHTRTNLERLNDVRDEIARQLEHLQKQADTAEKFTALRAEERRVRAELLVLKLRDVSLDLEQREALLREVDTVTERHVADVRRLESELETVLQAREQASEHFNQAQGGFYAVGNAISRTEQSIQHQRELQSRQQRERGELQQALHGAESRRGHDQARLDELAARIENLTPAWEAARQTAQSTSAAVTEQESTFRELQRAWERFSQSANEPVQRAQVERARMEQLERHSLQLRDRRQRITAEFMQLQEAAPEDDLEELRWIVAQKQAALNSAQQALEQLQRETQQRRDGSREQRVELDRLQREAQQLRGRLASLETLQQAALGKEQRGTVAQWLEREGLRDAPRLGERVQAEARWSGAVERVLEEWLEAVEVDGIDAHAEQVTELKQGHIALFEAMPGQFERPAGSGETLRAKTDVPLILGGLLGRIRVAETPAEALAVRAQLRDDESVITPEGFWCGRHWLRWRRERDGHAGVIARRQEIEQLEGQAATLEDAIAQRSATLEHARLAIATAETEARAHQAALAEANRGYADANAQLSRQQSRLEQVAERRRRIEHELQEIAAQQTQEQEALADATEARNEAMLEIETLQAERAQWQQRRDEGQTLLDSARGNAQSAREAEHRLNVERETSLVSERAIRDGLLRIEQQIETLHARHDELEQILADGIAPLAQAELELESLVAQRQVAEATLQQARQTLQEQDQALRERERLRHAAEQAATEQRALAEGLRLERQERLVRRQALLEQLAESEFDLHRLQAEMPEAAQVEAWEQQVERLAQRIQRLGPINLAAIDEYRELNERKTYLDQQNDDLTQALATLDTAIEKIDRETRARFKDTFEIVNIKLQEMFPKLFGGGQAYLEMTEDNLLTTGVTIMARPPGKRISSIHLLSGGEKALTAVALVFSIFDLNPAPFCMLDEVDAPLDEANVGRFCELVRQMSQRVQFIFITHNKTTMELAECLVGVTMREPGVSRMVDVNIEEAVKMATG
ncbi:MAG: chromosome segregation protein SMC [Thiotrichales bacterium]